MINLTKVGEGLSFAIRGSSHFNDSLDGFMYSVNDWLQSAPLSALFLVRFVYPYPLNNIFLVSLNSVNEAFYTNLKTYSYYLQYWKELRLACARNFKRFVRVATIIALSRVPRIGWMAIPMASIQLTSEPFGYPIAIALASLPLIMPSTKPWILHTLKSYYGIRALSRELLEPYLGRLALRFRDKRKFFREHESYLLGFSLLFYILINITFVGPIFFVIGQSAIAVLLSETTDVPPPNPASSPKAEGEDGGMFDLSEPSEVFKEPVASLDSDSKVPKFH